MKRRRLLAGLGTLAAGSAAAVGTGAFTSAEASRTVNVNVASEDEAYLALSPTGGENATFVSQDSSTNNELSIDINDANGVAAGADGVGLDSVYEFDNLFQVENQGTQEVEFEIGTLDDSSDFTPSTSGLTAEFYPGTDSDSPLDSNPVTLGTGDAQTIGLKLDIEEPDVDDFNAEATVNADAT